MPGLPNHNAANRVTNEPRFPELPSGHELKNQMLVIKGEDDKEYFQSGDGTKYENLDWGSNPTTEDHKIRQIKPHTVTFQKSDDPDSDKFGKRHHQNKRQREKKRLKKEAEKMGGQQNINSENGGLNMPVQQNLLNNRVWKKVEIQMENE